MAGSLRRGRGCRLGGIRELVKLIDEHRGAFEYDWRTRFGSPLKVLGRSMSWGEAQRLTVVLLRDPGSQVAAAVRGWSHPIGREDMVLRDIFDLQHISKAKRKPEPYSRPWHPQPKRIGGANITSAEFAAMKKRLSEQN